MSGAVLDASEKELDARHTQEGEELEARGLAHVEAVPAGKGKVAKVEAAKREVDQWVFEMKERHAEELDELRAGPSGAGCGAGPPEAAVPKVALSASEAKKAAAAANASAAADEAEKVRLKKEKARAKKQVVKDQEKQHEAEKERERRLNPPVPVPDKGKGYGKGGGEGGGGGGGACRAFAAGNCSFGDNCRFTHAPAGASER